jgi:polysaccharide export outer membrane protein
VQPVRLDLVVKYPQKEDNTDLKPRDKVIVFSLGGDRAPLLKPILDQLRRQANIDDPERIVTISGNVKFPGQYPLHRGMRVSDLARAGILSPNSDLDYALLERTTSPGNRVSVQSVRLASAASPDTIDNLPLKAFDRFIVFSNAAGRQELIKPTIGKLRLQARVDSPEQVVVISGQVAFPGEYPLEKDMTVSDLLRASGNLKQQAYQLEAELIHYQIIDSKIRETHRLPLDFSAIIKGDEKHDQILRPFDAINIKQVAEWGDRQTVEVRGEVMFPGGYVVERGETLTDLIERVGGFTERAFLDGAVLVREDLRNKEQEQINRLRDQLKGDLAAIELQQFQEDPQKREALSMAQGLLAQLESTKAVGRLVIDLEGIAYGVKTDIVLQDKDRIFIPDTPQEVSVLGEVNYPTSHVFDEKLARDDYINQSGGATYKADKGRIYVVKANGQVMSPKASTWFYKGQQGIQVGDTIVVPLDADRVSPLFLWTSIAQIVYQGALTIAAFNSIGVF